MTIHVREREHWVGNFPYVGEQKKAGNQHKCFEEVHICLAAFHGEWKV